MLLTYGPHIILYRSTKLSDESALKSCSLAAVGFAATQVLKIFLMAALLSSADDAVFAPTQEVMKLLVNVVELYGTQLTLKSANLSKFDYSARILAVGLGWSFAESVALFFIPLWIGARGMEFSWEYIEMGIASNINLLFHLAFVAAVWLRTRTDLEASAVPFIYGSIVAYTLWPSVNSYLALVAEVDSWYILGLKLVLSIGLALIARLCFGRYITRHASAS